MAMSLHINGTNRSLTCQPDTQLLYALRSDLGLVGSRYGCGAGYCGACMVLVDGRPTSSCDISVESVVGSEIVTIEGLELNDTTRPLQDAFIDLQAAQCGYCVSGIIVAATALLESTEQPTQADVIDALEQNLCRCGAHTRIIAAILEAARHRAHG